MTSTITNNNNNIIYKESSIYDNSGNNNSNRDDNGNKELRKSLLLVNNQQSLKDNSGNGNQVDEDEFQEIEIPIDDDDNYYYSIKQLNQAIDNNTQNDTQNNNQNNNNNNNESFSIDIDSDVDDESDIVDYKSIQPNVIKSKNKVVLVIVNNRKDGTLSLNAKYPRELSNYFSSSDYLQIKSEINELKSNLDTLFNRLIVVFSVGGAICILASLLLWYINSNFITVGTITCLVVGILLWMIFGLFIELKNHYRIQNKKEYFKELNERFGQSGLKFRAKFDKSRHKNPIALIIEYKQ